MTMGGGVAAVYTVLDENDPVIGATDPGTSNKASHGDHVHPLLIPIGVFVGSDNYPQLETTSTLCYIWIPSGSYLGWDDVNQLFVYV